MMTKEREDQIRRRAHEIWEREGRQHGQHDQHWEQARAELEREAEGDPAEAAQMASMIGASADPAEVGVRGGRARKPRAESAADGGATKTRKPRRAPDGSAGTSPEPSTPLEVTTEGTKPDGAPPSQGRATRRASTQSAAEGAASDGGQATSRRKRTMSEAPGADNAVSPRRARKGSAALDQ